MIAYNVKIKDFLDGQQVTIYSNAILRNVGKKEKNDYEKVFNPFTNSYMEKCINFDELEERHEKSISNSVARTKNKIIDYARSNRWEWFLTFTFKDDEVRNNYDLCTKKLSVWLNNMQKACNGNMKYVLVPEQHKKGGFHFHALVSNCEKELNLVSSKRYALNVRIKGKKKTIYIKEPKGKAKEVFNVGKYKWGFTTATRIENTEKASNYITKYITKDLVSVTPNKKRYWCSKNLDVPMETMLNLIGEDLAIQYQEIQGNEKFYKQLDNDSGNGVRTIRYYELDKNFYNTKGEN